MPDVGAHAEVGAYSNVENETKVGGVGVKSEAHAGTKVYSDVGVQVR